MIYAIFGALVVGLSLGIFGSGGSILTVPVLIYLLHHEDKVAIAESLGIVGSIALIGSIPYAREKLVDWRTAMLFGIPGMLGTLSGAWIAGYVPSYVQLFVFGGVMALAALRMWQRSSVKTAEHEHPEGYKAPHLLAGSQGFGVGILTGFVGVGGGFLIVPALVLVAKLPMRRAVATSLVIISMNAAVGLFKYQHYLTDQGASPAWEIMGVFILIGSLGSFIGKSIHGKVNQRALQRAFALFLILMAGFILVREGRKLFTQHEQSTHRLPLMNDEQPASLHRSA